MIDRWEQQLADGKEPDLLEAFDPTEITRIGNLGHAAKNAVKSTFGDMDKQAVQHATSVLRKKGLNPF